MHEIHFLRSPIGLENFNQIELSGPCEPAPARSMFTRKHSTDAFQSTVRMACIRPWNRTSLRRISERQTSGKILMPV